MHGCVDKVLPNLKIMKKWNERIERKRKALGKIRSTRIVSIRCETRMKARFTVVLLKREEERVKVV